MPKWNFCAILAEAAKYPHRSAFNKGKRAAYDAAKDQGLLELIYPPKPKKPKPVRALPSPTISDDLFEPSPAQLRAMSDLDKLDDPQADFDWIKTQPLSDRDHLWKLIKSGR